MVKLRLKRLGRKKHPFYRIVAMNANAPRSGQALAELGTYDPMAAVFDLDEEAALQWLRNGAQMSETVENLFRRSGILGKEDPGSESCMAALGLPANRPTLFRDCRGGLRERSCSRPLPVRADCHYWAR